MYKIARKSGMEINFSNSQFYDIRSDLTVMKTDFITNEREETYYFKDTTRGMIIPRFYPLSGYEIIDERCEGETVAIDSTVQLRTKTQEDAVNFFLNNENGILKANPGFGKTVCSIHALCLLRKKALIIAHKDSLIEQWIKQIVNFTNLEKEDIGRLTTSKRKYKENLDKRIIVSTPHVIALAVKNKKEYFLEYLRDANIGVLLCDECHASMGSEAFTKASIEINAKRVYGLSATPYRPDDTNKILKYHFGDITEIEQTKEETIIPKIFSVHWDFDTHKHKSRYINFGGRFSLDKYCKQVLKSEKYNNVAVYIINKSYDEGRNILVVGNYTSSLLELARLCKAPPEDIGIFLPSIMDKKKKEILKVSDTTILEEAFQKRIVFGTYTGVRDGNNRENLDCAIMTTPCNNIIQLVGRINRQMEGKPQPIAFEFVDTDPTISKIWNSQRTEKIQKFQKHFEDRLKQYQELNWPVQVIKK